MNLAQVNVPLSEDAPREDITARYQAEEARLIRIVEAIQGLKNSKEWSTLKTEVFDNLANVLERNLKTEAKKEDCDPKRLNRLAGELKWAEKFADLDKLETSYRLQLQNVRNNIHGKSE